MRFRVKNRDGFTIIELIVVIVIIGLLVGIAMVAYTNMVSRANLDVCLSNRKTIEKARVYYYIYNDSFGSNMAEISDSLDEMGLGGSDLDCPSGGTYSFIEGTHGVTCSIAEHNI